MLKFSLSFTQKRRTSRPSIWVPLLIQTRSQKSKQTNQPQFNSTSKLKKKKTNPEREKQVQNSLSLNLLKILIFKQTYTYHSKLSINTPYFFNRRIRTNSKNTVIRWRTLILTLHFRDQSQNQSQSRIPNWPIPSYHGIKQFFDLVWL